jgi:hypothetical protein
MKKYATAIVLAFLVSIPVAALAAVVTVSGHGQSYDYATAMADARADAIAACTAQNGTPLDEVYSHVTRADQWLADVILRCEI